MSHRSLCLFLFVALGAGCAAGGDNADPVLEMIDGKTDFAEAQDITYGEGMTGQVNGHAFSLFSLDVEDGDRFDVVVRRTSGDFDPRSVVYGPSLSPIRHVEGSFERVEGGNKKTFLMGDYSSTVLLLVRADRYEGAGDFEITVECTGGPCAGELPLSGNENMQLGICLTRARMCAFSQLDSGEASSRAGAADLVAACLEAEADCSADMCDAPIAGAESPRAYCDGLADALVFYAARPAACRGVFDGCMDVCTETEENSPYLEYDENEFEFRMTGEAVCWWNEYGETCDEFSRAHEACGGSTYREIDGVETAGTCYASWRASEGAWFEFEDDILDCSDTCITAEEQCTEQCETDDPDLWAPCFRDCANDHPLVADDDAYVCDL